MPQFLCMTEFVIHDSGRAYQASREMMVAVPGLNVIWLDQNSIESRWGMPFAAGICVETYSKPQALAIARAKIHEAIQVAGRMGLSLQGGYDIRAVRTEPIPAQV